MKKVFLFGYYGFDNLGDDLILKSIIEKFGENFEFNVLTYSYEKTEKLVDANPISRSNFFSIIKNIKKSDIIASGGGSLLQDVTSSKSLYFYLGLLVIGKLFRKKTIFLYNGIGPVHKKINRFMLKCVLKRIDKIYLRDNKSKEFLNQIGIKNNVYVVGDAVFLNDYPVNREFKYKNESKKVIISLRKWKKSDKNKIDEFVKLVNYLVLKGYKIEFLAFKTPDDVELLNKIKMNVNGDVNIISNDLEIDKLFNKIEEAHFLIGERLHSLILSAICETPFIGIKYDPKITGFVQMVNQIISSETEKISFDLLVDSVNAMENNYNYYYDEIKCKKNEISNNLNESANIIFSEMK